MELLHAILLGVIQGFSEWLPVSSEAMVTLAGKFLFNMEYQEALSSAIWLHSGTVVSAVIYFRNDILDILRLANRQLLSFLAISTLSTAIVAIPLLFLALNYEFPESLFTIFIGLFLMGIGYLHKTRKIYGSQKKLTDRNAVISGFIQGLAALPGISRSGITIATLLSLKYTLKQSFKLSFLMSIPVTFGVQVFFPLIKTGFAVDAELIAGSVAAAIVGLATISTLMKIAEKVNFSSATFALGVLVVVLGLAI